MVDGTDRVRNILNNSRLRRSPRLGAGRDQRSVSACEFTFPARAQNMSQVPPKTIRTDTNLSSTHLLIFIGSENGAARRDRQAQHGNRSSEILRITCRRATGGERSSGMRRTTHTVQQKFDVGKRKLATVRQK